MTVEEIEIIVTARMEELMKEIKKLEPTLKEMTKKVKESMANIDTKQMTNKVNQAVQFVKKKIADLRKTNKNNEVKITVNNKEASEQIAQLEKEIDSLQKKINARQLNLDITNRALDKMRNDTRQQVISDMPDAGARRTNQQTELRLFNDNNYMNLVKQSDKLNNEIIKYNALLDSAKSKMSELGQETNQTGASQNKLASFFGAFKSKLDQSKGSLGNLKNAFSQIHKITQNITNNIKGMGKNLKSGISHVLRYAMALFSLRGIYSVLSSSAQSWLSSQNKGAQQLSANIEYMKNAMGSALAPVIQFVTNLIYKLMKAIQSVVYALFRVNIFANASASSMGKIAGNTKKTTKEAKQLSGVHDEINNIQEQDDSSSNDGDDGATPSFDLSGIDSQLSPLAQKLYDFFKPLKESWDSYGQGLIEQVKTTATQVSGLIASVWGSFEKIITNGTVYFILENILAIIGNIAEAFANAWNYNGNGDAIVQNLANAFNNLLTAINNVVQSARFSRMVELVLR